MCYISLLVKPKEKCYASWTKLFICLHWLENFIFNLTLKASNFRTPTSRRVLSMNTHNTLLRFRSTQSPFCYLSAPLIQDCAYISVILSSSFVYKITWTQDNWYRITSKQDGFMKTQLFCLSRIVVVWIGVATKTHLVFN